MFCFTWSNIGASCCLSLLCCVISAATMICASLVHGNLCIVGLQEAAVRPVGHDPAVRVEVPLGLWFRHRLLGIGNLGGRPGVFRPVSASFWCRSAIRASAAA